MTTGRRIGILIFVVLVAVAAWAIYYSKHKNSSSNNTPNLSVTVFNQTQNADGTQVAARPNDTLVYTLTAANPNDKVISGYTVQVQIGDATGNATLVDAQGANYDSGSNSLIWTPLDIQANSQIQKQFTMKVKNPLPAGSNSTLKVTFNNQVVTTISASQTAVRPGNIGSTGAYTAPKTGIPLWISLYLAGFITLGIFLFRMAGKLGNS